MPFPFIPWFSVASKAALRIQKKKVFRVSFRTSISEPYPIHPQSETRQRLPALSCSFWSKIINRMQPPAVNSRPCHSSGLGMGLHGSNFPEKMRVKNLFVVQIASERWPLLESSLVSRLWAIESCVSTVYLWQLGGTSQLPPTGEDIRIMIESQDGGTAGDLEAILRQAKILDLNLTDLCS